MNLVNAPALAASLGDGALRCLFGVLVGCIIDERLRGVADGDGLLKAVNMIIMKLLENAPKWVGWLVVGRSVGVRLVWHASQGAAGRAKVGRSMN